MRHTASVSSVAFGNNNSNLLVSASFDTTLKLWSLPKKLKAGKIFYFYLKIASLCLLIYFICGYQ